MKMLAALVAILLACVEQPTGEQIPIPEFFGVYALSDATLVELLENDELNDLEPDVKVGRHLPTQRQGRKTKPEGCEKEALARWPHSRITRAGDQIKRFQSR